MTKPSPLRDFDYNVIEDILEEGLQMVYHAYLERRSPKLYGLWNPAEALVQINPFLRRQEGKELEDVIILHEWLHAYGDLILEVPNDRFREEQIHWWAQWHCRQDPYVATYIRSFFVREGFWIAGSEKAVFRKKEAA